MVISLISWCLCVINSEYTVFDWRNAAQSSLQADSWCERDCQHSCEVFELQQQRAQFQFHHHLCSLTCPSHLRRSRFAEMWSTRLETSPVWQGYDSHLSPPPISGLVPHVTGGYVDAPEEKEGQKSPWDGL